MNPYEKFLDGRDTLTILTESADRFKDILERIGSENFDRSDGEGKWTVKQILLHLIHSEINYALRLRNSLTTADFTVQPFEQDAWVNREPELEPERSVFTFEALRNVNLTLIKTLSAEEKKRKFIHPELGELTVRTLTEMMAGHDLSHFGQLEKVADSLTKSAGGGK